MNSRPSNPNLLAGIEGRQKGVRIHYFVSQMIKFDEVSQSQEVRLTTASAEEKCEIDPGKCGDGDLCYGNRDRNKKMFRWVTVRK